MKPDVDKAAEWLAPRLHKALTLMEKEFGGMAGIVSYALADCLAREALEKLASKDSPSIDVIEATVRVCSALRAMYVPLVVVACELGDEQSYDGIMQKIDEIIVLDKLLGEGK